MRPSRVVILLFVAALILSAPVPVASAPTASSAAVQYVLRIPEPQHHWMQVQVTFHGVRDATLQLRMSRSSPGRYALHEFAKNVFDMHATDGNGVTLALTHPSPHQWDIASPPQTVVVRYRIYGDRGDGTYLQVDPTHMHTNSPSTFLWARGELRERPLSVRFEQPGADDWVIATQLFPSDDPALFTAPNLRYLMDSPIEWGRTRIYSFDADDGQTFRVALHHQGSDDEALEYLQAVEAIVAEARAVFGEYPRFDTGTYTFLADYLPWVSGDGMEHRNSTLISSSASLAQGGRRLLGTVAHEFFHTWNMERIRSASIEPFDFEHANMSSELWLGEGFTSYYGNLVMHRAGLAPLGRALGSMAGTVNAVTSSPGVRLRSAVQMSRLAPFVDAARSVDRTDWGNTFLSYYTYGSALALGLDLTLRDRSDGAITLDDYMRAMWQRFGKPGGDEPPAVSRPYTVQGAQQVLAQVSGDAAFAKAFFDRHVTGTEVIDYAPLLARAGLLLRRVSPDAAWLGAPLQERQGLLSIVAPTPFGAPAYEAGIDQDDVLLTLDGARLNAMARLQSVLRKHRPGDTVAARVRHRDGSDETVQIVLGANPQLEIVPIEQTEAALTPEQRRFREAWLSSQQ